MSENGNLNGLDVTKSVALKIKVGQHIKTLQELRMLSSVTLNCQVTKIVMNLRIS